MIILKNLRKVGFFLLLLFVIIFSADYSQCASNAKSKFAWDENIFEIVAELGSNGGGVRASHDTIHGNYIVALSFYPAKGDLTQAYEAARLDALKEISHFINGVEVSGQTKMKSGESYRYQNGQESSSLYEEFLSVTKTYFKGNVAGAQTWKKATKGKKVYVVMLLDETGLKQRGVFKKLGATDVSKSSNSSGSFSSAQRNNFISGPSTGGRDQLVTVTGIAPMRDGSTATARNEAIRDALRNAVQQVNGVIIQGRSGRWGKHVSNAISSRTEGYISTYKVLKEGPRYGDYEVMIEAVVNRSALVRDVDLYLEALASPTFKVNAPGRYYNWFSSELKKIGFNIIGRNGNASHAFEIAINQHEVPNSVGGPSAYSTEIAVNLVDLKNSEILFTIRNNPQRTQIFLSSKAVSKVASEKAAMKQLKKKMTAEIINALAQRSRTGQVYNILIRNANRRDYRLFKHCLESGGEGRIISWNYSSKNKSLSLKYRFPGSLSQAFDGVLHQLYDAYKLEGKRRKPKAEKIGTHEAIFEIIGS